MVKSGTAVKGTGKPNFRFPFYAFVLLLLFALSFLRGMEAGRREYYQFAEEMIVPKGEYYMIPGVLSILVNFARGAGILVILFYVDRTRVVHTNGRTEWACDAAGAVSAVGTFILGEYWGCHYKFGALHQEHQTLMNITSQKIHETTNTATMVFFCIVLVSVCLLVALRYWSKPTAELQAQRTPELASAPSPA